MKYYAAIKRNELLIHVKTLMDLRRIMLEKYKYAYKGIATGTLLVMKKLYTMIVNTGYANLCNVKKVHRTTHT